MNEKDDMITHLGILSNLENGRKLARFSNSPETCVLSCIIAYHRAGEDFLARLKDQTYPVGKRGG